MDSRENRPFAYEIKFLVPAGRADDVRQWARMRLDPDPNAASAVGDTYRITSLYFDTPEFGVFHRDGSHGRAKYRIRRYDAAGSVFLERKLRAHGIVTKRRTLVPVGDLDQLDEYRPAWAGDWFRRRVEARGMQPSCQISYQRTALMGMTDEGTVRLTVDDDLCACPARGAEFAPLSACVPLLHGESIVEMKFRMAMPAMFKEIVQEFRLLSRPVSKYRLALPVLGLAQERLRWVSGGPARVTAYA